MKVRIYAPRDDGPEELGTIVLRDGQLVPEPKIQALTNLLCEPLYIYDKGKDAEMEIDPMKDPGEVSRGVVARSARIVLLGGRGGGVSRPICAPLIKTSAVIALAALMLGCATAEMGRQIKPEDVAWIQKGVTTRAAIVQRLGPPMSETPDWTAMQFQSTSTTTTTTTGETQQSVTTTKVEPVNKLTRALYLHTKSEGGLFVGFTTMQEQFWLRYDEQGIVQDHGFQAGPSMQVR